MAERSGRKNWSNAARQGLSNTSNRFAGEIVTPSVAAIEEVSEPIVAVFKNPVTGEDIPLTQSQLESLEYRAPSIAQQMAETPGVGVSMAFDKAKEILERQKAIGAIQPRNLAPEIVESTGKEDYSRFGSTGETQVGSSQQINENLANVLNQRVPTYIEGNENPGGIVEYKLPTVERLDEGPVEFLATIPTNTVAADVDVDMVPLEDMDYEYDPVAEGDVDAPRTGTTPGVYSDEVVPELGTVTARQGTPSSILEAVISPTTRREGIALKVGPEEGVYRFDSITGKTVKVSEEQLEQEKQAFWDKIRSGRADEVSPVSPSLLQDQGTPSSEFPQRVFDASRSIDEMRQMPRSTVINELQRRAMRQAYNQATGNERELYFKATKAEPEPEYTPYRPISQRRAPSGGLGTFSRLNVNELDKQVEQLGSYIPEDLYADNILDLWETVTEPEQNLTPYQRATENLIRNDLGLENRPPRIIGLLQAKAVEDLNPEQAVAQIQGAEVVPEINLEEIESERILDALLNDTEEVPGPVGNWAGDLLRNNRVRLGLAGLGGVGLIGLIANRVSNNREERRQAAANSLNYPTMTGY